MKKLTTLLTLLMTIIGWSYTYSQTQSGTKELTHEQADKMMMHRMADCNTMSLQFEALKQDTSNLHNAIAAKDYEINRKEQVIIDTKNARERYRQSDSIAQKIIVVQNQTIWEQKKTIEDAKKRRFGIGPYAGIGFMGGMGGFMAGTSLGISIHYDLIRW